MTRHTPTGQNQNPGIQNPPALARARRDLQSEAWRVLGLQNPEL